MMLAPDTCITVPFFTSVTVTGDRGSPGSDGRGACHAGFQFVHGQHLPVDVEPEVLGHVHFLRAFRQLDDEPVAVDGDDLELLGLGHGAVWADVTTAIKHTRACRAAPESPHVT